MTDYRKEIEDALMDCLKYDDTEGSIDSIEALIEKAQEDLIEKIHKKTMELAKKYKPLYAEQLFEYLDSLKGIDINKSVRIKHCDSCHEEEDNEFDCCCLVDLAKQEKESK